MLAIRGQGRVFVTLLLFATAQDGVHNQNLKRAVVSGWCALATAIFLCTAVPTLGPKPSRLWGDGFTLLSSSLHATET